MDAAQRLKIANSFTPLYTQADLDITLSKTDFDIFDKGIFAKDMDEKWHIFVIGETLIFARSWTGICIFRISFQRQGDVVKLQKLQANRDGNQYRSQSIEGDIEMLQKLLQIFLKNRRS